MTGKDPALSSIWIRKWEGKKRRNRVIAAQ